MTCKLLCGPKSLGENGISAVVECFTEEGRRLYSITTFEELSKFVVNPCRPASYESNGAFDGNLAKMLLAEFVEMVECLVMTGFL